MAAKSTISLGIEVTGAEAFKSSLKACDAETKLLSAQMAELSSNLDQYGNKAQQNAAKIQNLGQQMQTNQQKVALLSTGLKQANEALAAYAQKLEQAKASGDSAAIERATTAYEKQRTKVLELETNLAKTNTTMNNLKATMDSMSAGQGPTSAFEKLKNALGSVHEGFEEVKSAAATLAPVWNAVKATTTAIAQGFVAVGKAAYEAANAIIDKMNKAVTGIAAAGAALVIGLGKVGLEYNAQMEGYITNFSTLLGSTEAAAKKVEELKQMAAKTPFGMEDLAKATQTLLSFGVEADKTKPILQALGDVSLGNKERFQQLALAFGQVSSSGKLTGQDLMQMINAGFNPLNEISKQTGESMEQLKDRMSKGAISAKEVEQAFISATSAGGQFYNGMEAASKTMDGMISTLKDNAKALVGEVFQPITNTIKNDLLPAALGYIQQLTDAFQKEGLTGLVNATGQILDQIMGKVQTSGPKIIEAAFGVVNQIIQRLTQSMPQMVKVGGELIDSVMNGLRNTLPKLGPIAAEIAPLIVKTITQYRSTLLKSGIEIIVAIVEGISKDMPNIMKTMSEGLTDLLKTITDNLPRFLKAAGDIIEQLVKGLLNDMPKVVNAITEIINELVNWIVDHLDLIIDAAIKIIAALANGLINALPNLISKLPQIVTSIVDGIGKAVSAVFDIGVNIVQAIWKGIQSVGDWLGQQISGFFSGIIDGAKKMLGIHSPSRVFMGIGENIALGMAEGIRGGAGAVQAAMDYITPSAGGISMGMDAASVAGRVAANGDGPMAWVDNRPIILTLNDRELGRAVRGYV